MRCAHTGASRYIGEGAVAIVVIERVVSCARPAAARHIKVWVAIVIVIGEEGAPAASRVGEARSFGNVRERAITVISVERVRLIRPDSDDVQIAIGIVIGPGTAAAAIRFVHL